MKTRSRKQPAGDSPTFESSMRRLEDIVNSLERGEVSLDESLALFEEGLQISKACLQKLSEAEARLKTLSRDVNGTFHLNDPSEDE